MSLNSQYDEAKEGMGVERTILRKETGKKSKKKVALIVGGRNTEREARGRH